MRVWLAVRLPNAQPQPLRDHRTPRHWLNSMPPIEYGIASTGERDAARCRSHAAHWPLADVPSRQWWGYPTV